MQDISITATNAAELTDAWDVALEALSHDHIADVTRGENSIAVIHAHNGSTMHVEVEVGATDEEWIVDGWTWATYDSEGQNDGQGGDEIAAESDFDAVVTEITDWADRNRA